MKAGCLALETRRTAEALAASADGLDEMLPTQPVQPEGPHTEHGQHPLPHHTGRDGADQHGVLTRQR